MTLLTDLQAAGLPVLSATEGVSACFTRGLTPDEEEIYHNLLWPERKAKFDKQKIADANSRKLVELAKLTPNQAESWVEHEVLSGNSEGSLLALANTVSDATTKNLFVIIIRMILGQMRVSKIIIKLLISIRDKLLMD